MFHYDYVPRKEAAPYKAVWIEILTRVQDELRGYFTFQFQFIGSASRNMITYDSSTNTGFDFDVNIEVNDDDESYTPEQIRTMLRNALTRIGREYGYNKCEDSTRVITVKRIDPCHSKIEDSCDFAIVHYGKDGQQYIRFCKELQSYSWEFQKQPYRDLEARADFLKEHGCWEEVRQVYLDKKNSNMNRDKHSRSLYAEAVNECYMRNSHRG